MTGFLNTPTLTEGERCNSLKIHGENRRNEGKHLREVCRKSYKNSYEHIFAVILLIQGKAFSAQCQTKLEFPQFQEEKILVSILSAVVK